MGSRFEAKSPLVHFTPKLTTLRTTDQLTVTVTDLPHLIVAVSFLSTLTGGGLALTPVGGAPATLGGENSLRREDWKRRREGVERWGRGGRERKERGSVREG